MKLQCNDCGNDRYFESDVERQLNVSPLAEELEVTDIEVEGFNWSDAMLRDGLKDNLDYCLKESADLLVFNQATGGYENRLIHCARCGSKSVTPPYSRWHPRKDDRSVAREICANREEFKHMRKEHIHANHLPILWQP